MLAEAVGDSLDVDGQRVSRRAELCGDVVHLEVAECLVAHLDGAAFHQRAQWDCMDLSAGENRYDNRREYPERSSHRVSFLALANDERYRVGAPGQVRPHRDAGPASLGAPASGGRPIAGGAQAILGRCARAVQALIPFTVGSSINHRHSLSLLSAPSAGLSVSDTSSKGAGRSPH